jgi:diguanylate cyclase (GGDEF)-like protein
MSGAEIVLVTNIVVASMFAACYFIVALMNPSQRGALWFGATYLVGMISPISDFVAPFSDAPSLFEWLSYATFLGGTLAMSASFSVFHGRQPPKLAILVIFFGGVVTRACIWGWTRDTLSYGFAYQLPLILASLLAAQTVLRIEGRAVFHIALACVFGAIAASLAAKPFFAAEFGSGTTISAYASTTYALISQASTGILLLAAGMILILIVAQKAISVSQLASETDPLSGLANRRGFDRQAQEMLVRTAHYRQSLSVVVFDLDHFKQINDTYGHESGDAVIAAFGALLRNGAPASAVIGRMGGEEFAMLVAGSDGANMWSHAEKIRMEALRTTRETSFSATVSGGVAERLVGETLAEMMRRADQALYQAKSEGRDRVCLQADNERSGDATTNVVPLFRGRTAP